MKGDKRRNQVKNESPLRAAQYQFEQALPYLDNVEEVLSWAQKKGIAAVAAGRENSIVPHDQLMRWGASFCLTKPIDAVSLVTQARSDLDPEQLLSALKPTLTHNVCSSAQMRAFMSPGVDLVYNYAAKDGAHVVSIRVERDACSS